MGKTISRFICQQCGWESYKWLGKCPGCGKWNTLEEEILNVDSPKTPPRTVKALPLSKIPDTNTFRFNTGIKELDRVLGGGVVPGSLILLGGDPGIGKSTLLLQVADQLSREGKKVLYLSGEESLRQIRLRANRMQINSDNIFLLNEQNIDLLGSYVKEIDPQIVIIDSIQTVYSNVISSVPGSVSQLKECTSKIMNIAKKSDKAFFLVGHVTKDGTLAGPKVLEHIVDVVIYFEGEKNFAFRLLRGVKNRFGATDELGLLEMSGQGLVEVTDPSYIFLNSNDCNTSGTAITTSFEGTRPLLIEIQSLVASSGPGYARRMASGIDQNRLSLIIAVIEKIRGLNLASYDVYLKVTGGLFLKDPSVDLGIALAIVSSFKEKPLPWDMVLIGEISLSGQIRSVPFLDLRLKEAEKMGFKRAIIPAGAGKNIESSLELYEIRNLDECIDIVMGG